MHVLRTGPGLRYFAEDLKTLFTQEIDVNLDWYIVEHNRVLLWLREYEG